MNKKYFSISSLFFFVILLSHFVLTQSQYCLGYDLYLNNTYENDTFIETCKYGCYDEECNAPAKFETFRDGNIIHVDHRIYFEDYENAIPPSYIRYDIPSQVIGSVISSDSNGDMTQLVICSYIDRWDEIENSTCTQHEYCKSSWGLGNLECGYDMVDYTNVSQYYISYFICDEHGTCVGGYPSSIDVAQMPEYTVDEFFTDEDRDLMVDLYNYSYWPYYDNTSLEYTLLNQSNLDLANCSILGRNLTCNLSSNLYGESLLNMRIKDRFNQTNYKNITLIVNSVDDVLSITKNVTIFDEKPFYEENDMIEFVSNATDIDSMTKMVICDKDYMINNDCLSVLCETNFSNELKYCQFNVTNMRNKYWQGYLCDNTTCVFSNEGELDINDIHLRSPKLYSNNSLLFSAKGVYYDEIIGNINEFNIDAYNYVFDLVLESNSGADIYTNISIEYDLKNVGPILNFSKYYYEINESQRLNIHPITFDFDSKFLDVDCNDSRVKKVNNNWFYFTPTFFESGEYNFSFNLTDGIEIVNESILVVVNNVNRVPIINIDDEYYENLNEEDFELLLDIYDFDNDELNFSIDGPGYISYENNSVHDGFAYYYNFDSNSSFEGIFNVTITVDDGEDSDFDRFELYIYNIDCYSDLDCNEGIAEDLFCDNDDLYSLKHNYTCYNPGLDESYCETTSYDYFEEDCDDECQDGECVVITCHDNYDCINEIETSLSCYRENLYKFYTRDVCKYPNTQQSYCQSETSKILEEDCKYGCGGSECLDENYEDICYDSDGGKNTLVAGKVIYDSIEYEDECTDSLKGIKEYYCDKGRLQVAYLQCDRGCNYGSCNYQNIIRTFYPTESELSYESATQIVFSIMNSDSRFRYHWYVNDNLVSTTDELDYRFINGQYDVRGELNYEGYVETKYWQVSINNDDSLENKVDVIANSFTLLNDILETGENYVTFDIFNGGIISAHDVEWRLVQNGSVLINGSLSEIAPGEYKTYNLAIDAVSDGFYYDSEGNKWKSYGTIGSVSNYFHYNVRLEVDYNNRLNDINVDNNMIYLGDKI